MSKEVEMKDAKAPAPAETAEAKEAREAKEAAEAKKKALADIVHDLRTNVSLLEKGVATKDARMISRVLRSSHGLRRRVTVDMLRSVVEQSFPLESAEKTALLKFLDAIPAPAAGGDNAMAVDASAAAPAAASAAAAAAEGDAAKPSAVLAKPKVVKTAITPELEVYLHLLVLLLLAERGPKEETFNRRTMDQLSARAWSHYALLQERSGKAVLAALRPHLMAAHRTACLRHDEPGQAVLINLILRNFLEFGLFAQADKFRLNSTFPANRSNYQHARYLYYTGRITAVQLDYSGAYTNLTEALRKAPAAGAALGFRQAATKLQVIVQLLMGEVPERALFRHAELSRSLRPYLHLTQAVRVGDLVAFGRVSSGADGAAFRADGTAALVARLRHNVIKVALRQINVSYARIPLADVAAKLALESEEDAACIVAKAIHDGVIEATIDHQNRCVCSNDASLDVYTSGAPRAAFHARIDFCLQLRNEAVKAMRFPMHMKREDLETEEERQEREAAEAELLANLDDGDDDDGGAGEDM